MCCGHSLAHNITERPSTFKCSIAFSVDTVIIELHKAHCPKCQVDNRIHIPYIYICNFGLHSINEFFSASSSVCSFAFVHMYATVVETVYWIGFCLNKIGLFHLNNLTASPTDVDLGESTLDRSRMHAKLMREKTRKFAILMNRTQCEHNEYLRTHTHTKNGAYRICSAKRR